MMNRLFLLLLLPAFLFSCSHKKKSMKGEDKVEITDFIDFFPESNLPIRITEASLNTPQNDSMLISHKIFSSFVPDSILARDFGKNAKPKIHAIGRTRENGKDHYLFVHAAAGSKKVAYLAVFSPDHSFAAALPLVKSGFEKINSAYGSLDSKFQITTYKDKLTATGVQFKRNVYIYNSSASEFTLIMTEPNEEIIEQVINPIDTLPRKNRFSGNYVKDKRNFITVRDGRNAGSFQFFIHFEKENGTCNGELKGTARVISKTTAQYQEPGNPCALEFTFTGSAVSLKETGGCGSYRDIKCFFEGSYPRKNDPPPAREKGRKKGTSR